METNEPKKIKVEMWSDFMCPLCYIGKTNLENALDEFQHNESIEIVYRPFQLFQDAPVNNLRNYYEYTSMTHGGMPVEAVKEGNRGVIELAKSVGLNYNLDILIPTNTLDALRIAQYAQEKGKAKEFTARIYSAYLIEGLNIADAQTLVNLGSEIGLDAKEITEILHSDKYKEKIANERSYAESLGIRGTPFFVINNKYGISGVKSKEEFLSLLNQVWNEENDNRQLKIIEGKSCDINGECK